MFDSYVSVEKFWLHSRTPGSKILFLSKRTKDGYFTYNLKKIDLVSPKPLKYLIDSFFNASILNTQAYP